MLLASSDSFGESTCESAEHYPKIAETFELLAAALDAESLLSYGCVSRNQRNEDKQACVEYTSENGGRFEIVSPALNIDELQLFEKRDGLEHFITRSDSPQAIVAALESALQIQLKINGAMSRVTS